MANGYVGIQMSYTPVEYIESTGTQYIDTRLINTTGFHIKTNISFSNFANLQQFTGSYYVNDPERCLIRATTSKTIVTQFYGYNTNNVITSPAIAENTKYEIEARLYNGQQYLKIDGTTIGTKSLTGASFSNIPIYLLAICSTGNPDGLTFGKLYNAQYYDKDGVLIRDFIPVVDNNNVACLYEQVEGKFYYNAGTGTFTAGSATGQPVIIGDKAKKIVSGYVGIPTSYTPVEYIESSGTQYINTGIVPNSATRMILELSNTDNTVNNRNGWGSTGSAEAFFCGMTSSSTYFYASVSSNWAGTNSTTPIDTNKHTFDISNSAIKLDGTSFGTGNIGNTATTGQTLYIFSLHTEYSPYVQYCKEKIYSCKIYDGNTLVRDYIPALDDNNVACLYDLAEGKLCYNNGTGTFIAGNTTGQPVSVGGRARKIIRGYVGVNGVARLAFGSFYPRYKTAITDTAHVSVPAAASTNDYFLIAGGITSGSTPIKTVTAFSNSLVATQAPDMAYQSWYLGSTSFNNHAIFLGGKTASSGANRTNQCLAYANNLTKSTLSNLWTSVYEAASASNSTHFIVAGGCSYSAWETSARAYDTNFTLSSPSSLSGRSAACQAASVGNYIIFNADYNGTNATTCYDNTNVKSTITNPYNKKVQYCLGLSTNSYAVFFGGSTGGNTSTAFKDCKAYDENKVVTSFNAPSALFQSQGFSTGDYAAVCCDNLTLIYDDNLVLVEENAENNCGHSYDRLGATMGSKGFIRREGSTLIRVFDI